MTTPFERRLNHALNELIENRPIEADTVRVTALATLTELFLEASRRDTSAIPEHFAEIMGALLQRVPPNARAEASRLLAHSDLLPCEIARQLAEDTADIAGPMLRQSPRLSQDFLLQVASGSCPRKALAVASRNDLSTSVVAALLDRNDTDIGVTLAEGQIKLDGREAGRIAMLPALPQRAAGRLVDATALDDEALAVLLWRADAPARTRIIERMSRRRAALPIDVNAIGRANAPSFGDEIVKLAAQRRTGEIAIRLAACLEITPSLAEAIVGDPGGETLVIAGRAAGLSIDHVTGLVLLTAAEARTSYEALRRLVDLAGRIGPDLALHIVDLWERRQTAQQPSKSAPARHEPAIAQPGRRTRPETRSVSRQLEHQIARTGSTSPYGDSTI